MPVSNGGTSRPRPATAAGASSSSTSTSKGKTDQDASGAGVRLDLTPTRSSIKPTNLLSFEERPLLVQLHGRNETSKLLVDGWTRRNPLRFNGLRNDLRIKTISSTTPSAEMPTKLTSQMGNRVKLSELSLITGRERARTPYPVLVTVLAKKSVEICVKEKCVIMFGYMFVGDASGYCRLCPVNDSVCSVYQQVEVGDRIFIGGASMIEHYQDEHLMLCLEDHYFVNMDIKLNIYDSRNIFKLVGVDDGKLPAYYTEERKILTVTELISPSLKDCVDLIDKPESYHFDVIGVVSYVGRMERRREFSGELFVGERSQDIESTTFFNVSRWIELVDKDSREPLPLIFYVGNNNWEVQSSLAPGCLVLITNVTRRTDFSQTLCSSRFSKMYVNKGLGTYLSLFPDSAMLCHLSQEFLGDYSAKRILGRDDVEWSVGGSYSKPILNEETFARQFVKKSHTRQPGPIVQLPTICQVLGPDCEAKFLHRESNRFTFRGYITKFAVITNKGQEYFTLNTNPAMRDQMGEEFKAEYAHSSGSFSYPHLNWFMFKRQLPKIDLNTIPEPVDEVSSSTPTHFYQEFSAQYKKYCEPLLFPSQGDMNLLKDLPALDCFPLIIIQLVNQSTRADHIDTHHREIYFCIWKQTRAVPLEKMVKKLKEVINHKSLCFIVDAHCTGIDPDPFWQKCRGNPCMNELVLQDVIVLPEHSEVLPAADDY